MMPGKYGGRLLRGGQTKAEQLKRLGGNPPVAAGRIRNQILAQMPEMVAVQVQTALGGPKGACPTCGLVAEPGDATRSFKALAEYAIGKPKRVELTNEQFAQDLIQDATEIMTGEQLEVFKARVLQRLADYAPHAANIAQAVDVTPASESACLPV
jgi:hypothetical protein